MEQSTTRGTARAASQRDDSDRDSSSPSSPPSRPARSTKRQMHSRTQINSESIHQPLPRYSADQYTIGWVCALPKELTAAQAMLDHGHQPLPNPEGDSNCYTFGDIHGHNVVLACLPSGGYGLANAASVSKDMQRSYPSIRVHLVVGIGGGVPGKHDVRLGDVVVGQIVVQHDLGRTHQDGQVELVGIPYRPPPEILTALATLQACHTTQPSGIPSILADVQKRNLSTTHWSRAQLEDHLYEANYQHVKSLEGCLACNQSRCVLRSARPDIDPRVHYGTIASGNQVIKDARVRDALVERLENAHKTISPILCVEMEAAGLFHNVPFLVVRGICDYADSHKNKQWQEYAAATSAAYTRELLSVLPHRIVSFAIGSDSQPTQGQPTQTEPNQTSVPLSTGCRQAIVSSLHFRRIDSRHEEIGDAEFETCKWLLEHPKYLAWKNPAELSNHGGFFWIKGKPGSGKSTMMKFLLSKYNTAARSSSSTVLAFFFNARGTALEKTTLGMYRSLLFQLLERHPDLQDAVDIFPQDIFYSEEFQWDLHKIRKLFPRILQRLGSRPVTFFIDALDECDDDQVLEMISDFERFGRNAVEVSASLHVCLSSRHYPHIEIETGLQLALENEGGHTKDMETYIGSKLRIGKGRKACQTKKQTVRKADSVFLRLVVAVPILQKEFGNGRPCDVDRVMAKLRELPSRLSDLFRSILGRGGEGQSQEDRDSLILCIRWILFAARPLKPPEFYYAVMSGLPDCEPQDPADWEDDLYPRVQFIHESVRDFLLKEGGLRELFPDLEPEFDFEGCSHNQVKLCCQAYLQTAYYRFTPPQTLPNVTSKEMKQLRRKSSVEWPFLEYASSYILSHADRAAATVSQADFLQQFQRDFQSWAAYWNVLATTLAARLAPRVGLALYRTLARQNLKNLLSKLLQDDPTQVSMIQAEGYSLLQLVAADSGSPDTLELLLDVGADVRGEEADFRLPAKFAAENGHLEVIKLLIHKGADINQRVGSAHDRPLYIALQKGHFSICRALVEAGADLSDLNNVERTKLLEALLMDSSAYHPIQREVIAKLTDYEGNTAIHLAAGRGSHDAVSLAIEQGADVNQANHSRETPLHLAVEYKAYDVVSLHMEKGADPSLVKNDGETALDHAASRNFRDCAATILRAYLRQDRVSDLDNDSRRETPEDTCADVAAQIQQHWVGRRLSTGFARDGVRAAILFDCVELASAIVKTDMSQLKSFSSDVIADALRKGWYGIVCSILSRSAAVFRPNELNEGLRIASVDHHREVMGLMIRKGANAFGVSKLMRWLEVDEEAAKLIDEIARVEGCLDPIFSHYDSSCDPPMTHAS